MTKKKRWEVELEKDPETGELILPFPQEMLDQLGWKDGDEIEWIDNKDGSWSIGRVPPANSDNS